MNCIDCDIELTAKIKKEKYKSKCGKHKLAVNINLFECPECKEIMIDEKEQELYQARCQHFANKVNNVSVH